VTLCRKLTRRQLLKAFPKIFTGDHLDEPFVDQVRAKKITISTSVPKVLTPDGELLGATPVEVACLHRAVEVFWK
jgi:diacylglycerol kinase (ATP)